MTARPDAYPDWATSDVVDGTSGQNNAVEPPASWLANGWSYKEKPPRNYDNWWKRYAGRWIRYLEERVTGGRVITVVDAIVEPSAGWGKATSAQGVEQGWVATAGDELWIPIPGLPGSIITELLFKVYNSSSLADSWDAVLYEVDAKTDDDTAAPSVAIACDVRDAMGIGQTNRVIELSAEVSELTTNVMPKTLGEDSYWIASVLNPNSTDRFIGVKCTYSRFNYS